MGSIIWVTETLPRRGQALVWELQERRAQGVSGYQHILFFPRTTRFASFPDYLVIQIKKFTFGLDWVPKKLGMVAGMQKILEKDRTLAHVNCVNVPDFSLKGENIIVDFQNVTSLKSTD